MFSNISRRKPSWLPYPHPHHSHQQPKPSQPGQRHTPQMHAGHSMPRSPLIPPTPNHPHLFAVLCHMAIADTLQRLSKLPRAHGFFADYSDTFRTHADDNTTCPCGEVLNISPVRHSLEHVLFRCPLHFTPRARHLGGYSSLRALLSSEDGGHRLVKFLHYT